MAPEGWRVATSSDFLILIDNNGGSSSVGGKMKDTSFGFWTYPNTDASNCLKFNSIPFGSYNYYGNSVNIGEKAIYLTSTSNHFYYINYNSGSLYQDIDQYEDCGLIRLIKE